MSGDTQGGAGRWKDFLDAASNVAGVLTTVILGWLTVSLTWNDQVKRSEQATTDTVLKVVELSVAKDDATRNIGLTMIGAIQHDAMGGLLDQRVVTQNGFQVLLSKLTDTISSAGATPAIKVAEPPTPVEAGNAAAQGTPIAGDDKVVSGADGWVYLGTWDAVDGHWVSQYLSFGAGLKPDELVGKQLKISAHASAVYVRSGPSTPTGLAPVIATLASGQQVIVRGIKAGSSNAHYWAQVAY
jgi:hypothetical protein